MTLLGVFFNLADSRTGLMVRIEAYLDNRLLPATLGGLEPIPPLPGGEGLSPPPLGDPALGQTVLRFGQSVEALEQIVTRFDTALARFSDNTRDFNEFNVHLKDNIQRMSLSFGDLSQALKTHATGLDTPVKR